jgi:hypothetical protein
MRAALRRGAVDAGAPSEWTTRGSRRTARTTAHRAAASRHEEQPPGRASGRSCQANAAALGPFDPCGARPAVVPETEDTERNAQAFRELALRSADSLGAPGRQTSPRRA